MRDLWNRTDKGSVTGSYTARAVPSHGAVMLKIVGTDKPTTIIEDDSSAWVYSGTWGSTTTTCDGRSGCSSHWSNHAGDTATLTYNNSRVEPRVITGSGGGIVGLRIDGGEEVLYDTYSPTYNPDTPLADVSGLPGGTHTVTIRVTGEKNAASSGTYANVSRALTNP